MIDDDERIRRKAHELWEAEGRPEGRSDSHWTAAREIIALEDAGDTARVPLRQTLGDDAEPAIAYENQGEFPDLVDQGEAQGAPSLDRAADTADVRPDTVEDAPPPTGRRRTARR